MLAGSVAGGGFWFPTTYPSSCHQKQHWQAWWLTGHHTWCCRLWSHTLPQSLSLCQKSAGLKREKRAENHNQNSLPSKAAALPQHRPESGQLQQHQEGHKWKYGSHSSKNMCTYWTKGTHRVLTENRGQSKAGLKRQGWDIIHSWLCRAEPFGCSLLRYHNRRAYFGRQEANKMNKNEMSTVYCHVLHFHFISH